MDINQSSLTPLYDKYQSIISGNSESIGDAIEPRRRTSTVPSTSSRRGLGNQIYTIMTKSDPEAK